MIVEIHGLTTSNWYNSVGENLIYHKIGFELTI